MRGAALLVATLAAGCGYAVGPDALYAHRSVSVSVLDNVTERRVHEFDLTQSVIRQMQAAGIAVNAPDAPVRVEMRILEIREPALVEGPLDAVTVGSVSFRVRLRLVDRASGRELAAGDHEEHAAFASARGESAETARRQVFDRISRWAASKLEKDW